MLHPVRIAQSQRVGTAEQRYALMPAFDARIYHGGAMQHLAASEAPPGARIAVGVCHGVVLGALRVFPLGAAGDAWNAAEQCAPRLAEMSPSRLWQLCQSMLEATPRERQLAGPYVGSVVESALRATAHDRTLQMHCIKAIAYACNEVPDLKWRAMIASLRELLRRDATGSRCADGALWADLLIAVVGEVPQRSRLSALVCVLNQVVLRSRADSEAFYGAVMLRMAERFRSELSSWVVAAGGFAEVLASAQAGSVRVL